jgi:hypothetical protein
VKRTFSSDDPGNAFRRTDATSAKEGGIYKLEDSQWTFTDGQGNKYWFVDTTAAPVTVTLPSAADNAPHTIFSVKRLTAGANALTVQAVSGNIDGSATHSIPTQYALYSYVAHNGDYWIV